MNKPSSKQKKDFSDEIKDSNNLSDQASNRVAQSSGETPVLDTTLQENDQIVENSFSNRCSALFNQTVNAGMKMLNKSKNSYSFENWPGLLKLIQSLFDLIHKNPNLAWEELAQGWLEKEGFQRVNLLG